MIDFLKGTVTKKDWLTVGIILGVTAAVAVVFVMLVRAEQVKTLNDLKSQLSTAEAELQKAITTQKNIAQLRQETNEVMKVVEDFEQRLPSEREMPSLLQEFEAMARTVGLDVDLTTLDSIVDDRKETVPYSVVARGSFHQIVSFINSLEKYKRYLKVSNLIITEQKEGAAQAKFTLSTFSFREAKPATPAAAGAASQQVAAASGGAQ